MYVLGLRKVCVDRMSIASKKSRQMKIYKWKIINVSLAFIRRGYSDLIAKFISIWQVYPYSGDGYIKLSN